MRVCVLWSREVCECVYEGVCVLWSIVTGRWGR